MLFALDNLAGADGILASSMDDDLSSVPSALEVAEVYYDMEQTLTTFLGGGDGNDDITDADGKTYLHGGDGADVFRFVSDGDADRVHDFELGVDTLDVSAWGVTSLSELAFNTNGTKLVISFEDETIVLDRLAEENGNFTADNFIFV
ncbi:Mannuronan C5-epimerase AlgE2 [Nymphon striatum]|nr:Mannuronan C5-epimerase AlgE2 [Nymphon striatum]